MNTQAGNWERSKTTAEGRMQRGAQPMITVGFAASCGLATKLVSKSGGKSILQLRF